MTDHDQQHVKAELEARGLLITAVAEDSTKTPDLLVEFGSKRAFVEVKSRLLDTGFRKELEAVPAGSCAKVETLIAKRNRISAIVRKAVEQLKSKAEGGDYKILWFRANEDLFVRAVLAQVVATLLGVRHVSTSDHPQVVCFYASHADFHKFPDLDGAVVECEGQLRFFANEFSPRYSSLKSSALLEKLTAGMITPDMREGEALGACLILEGESVDRSSDDSILSSLRSKYPDRGVASFVTPAAVTRIETIDARELLKEHEDEGGYTA